MQSRRLFRPRLGGQLWKPRRVNSQAGSQSRANARLARAAYQAGEIGAFEVLYERHAQAVLTYLAGMLGNRDEAEDGLQQVFSAFVARTRQLPPDTNIRASICWAAPIMWSSTT